MNAPNLCQIWVYLVVDFTRFLLISIHPSVNALDFAPFLIIIIIILPPFFSHILMKLSLLIDHDKRNWLIRKKLTLTLKVGVKVMSKLPNFNVYLGNYARFFTSFFTDCAPNQSSMGMCEKISVFMFGVIPPMGFCANGLPPISSYNLASQNFSFGD